MARKKMGTKNRKAKPAPAPHTSKIIKAGALLGDTKTLFSHWDVEAPVRENIKRIRRENVFGKSSRSRVEDILAIFRQRYLSEESVTRALVVLVNGHFSATSLHRILYFHSMRADRLLSDVVTEILLPLNAKGITDIHVIDVQSVLGKWVQEGKMTSHWCEQTVRRVTQGLLSTLRDFGVLEGARNKRIAPAYLPVEAFAYVMFYLKQHQPSGINLLDLPDWKLFFLQGEGVERFLLEAHQRHLLEYHAAGTVTRLTFPVGTLEEYANVLAEGAD